MVHVSRLHRFEKLRWMGRQRAIQILQISVSVYLSVVSVYPTLYHNMPHLAEHKSVKFESFYRRFRLTDQIYIRWIGEGKMTLRKKEFHLFFTILCTKTFSGNNISQSDCNLTRCDEFQPIINESTPDIPFSFDNLHR